LVADKGLKSRKKRIAQKGIFPPCQGADTFSLPHRRERGRMVWEKERLRALQGGSEVRGDVVHMLEPD
jgi:hypothetical protein